MLPDPSNFWKKVNVIDDDSSCWEWTGSRDKDGYGRIGINRQGVKKTFKAHRLSWIYENGEIPEENCICHKCDNPPCVRPDHLELGTVWDNNHDKEKKNRQSRGERNGMRVLTDGAVAKVRELYSTGSYTQSELAEAWGITPSAVSKIVLKKRWQHVGMEEFAGKRKEKGIQE